MAGKKVEWLDRTLVNAVKFSLCTCPIAYAKELRRLKVPEPLPFLAAKNGAETHTLEDKEGGLCCVVTIDPTKMKRYSNLDVIAILAHEATHIWQRTLTEIGERSPSQEFEAYAIQNITYRLLESYEKQTGRRL